MLSNLKQSLRLRRGNKAIKRKGVGGGETSKVAAATSRGVDGYLKETHRQTTRLAVGMQIGEEASRRRELGKASRSGG